MFQPHRTSHLPTSQDFALLLITDTPKIAVQILGDYPNSDIAQVVVNVTAANPDIIINRSNSAWYDIVAAHPTFASAVLKKVFPDRSTDGRYNSGIQNELEMFDSRDGHSTCPGRSSQRGGDFEYI